MQVRGNLTNSKLLTVFDSVCFLTESRHRCQTTSGSQRGTSDQKALRTFSGLRLRPLLFPSSAFNFCLRCQSPFLYYCHLEHFCHQHVGFFSQPSCKVEHSLPRIYSPCYSAKNIAFVPLSMKQRSKNASEAEAEQEWSGRTSYMLYKDCGIKPWYKILGLC